ncbi:MAG TPA: methylated-DNA--[protein]-cysteine S-methyltransferase [Candidatus Polarisedimenticolia bacterium]|nr:methylated-DNA--[protein]-cysteine S-methyltransferase [Candidatus Polarisedimenticolia bacterium]
MELQTRSVISPIGTLCLYASGPALVALALPGGDEELRAWLARRFGDFRTRSESDPAGAASALRAYFAGELAALDRIEVDPGGTSFQRSVWMELRRIPPGTAISYACLASRVRRPKAMRAVGAANGSNPIPLVLPCHRVVAADGTLCGYGGGLEAKQWLLVHEKALASGAWRLELPSSQLPLL